MIKIIVITLIKGITILILLTRMTRSFTTVIIVILLSNYSLNFLKSLVSFLDSIICLTLKPIIKQNLLCYVYLLIKSGFKPIDSSIIPFDIYFRGRLTF